MQFKTNPDLSIKYHLECYQSVPSYPTKTDFMFDILSYLIRVSESKTKTWDPNEIKFSTKTLKYVFGDKLTQQFLEKLKPIIETLVQEGALIKKGEYLYVTDSEFSKYFTSLN